MCRPTDLTLAINPTRKMALYIGYSVAVRCARPGHGKISVFVHS
jgi:hypothetical protein